MTLFPGSNVQGYLSKVNPWPTLLSGMMLLLVLGCKTDPDQGGGCRDLPAAAESNPTNHVMRVVDRFATSAFDPNYWIIQDSRNGAEYLVVIWGGEGIAITPMKP